jgi:polar amino acid transport system substrate-binding protein
MNQKLDSILSRLFSCLIILIFFIQLPAFAADKKEVYAVTEPWAPYMSPELLNKGFISELFVEALKRKGYTSTVTFIAWSRAVRNVQVGRADAICGAYYTDERAKFLAYSVPITEVQDVLFCKKENMITYKQLTDLKEYQIGIIRGASYGDAFNKADFLKKQIVKNNALNIVKLMKGRIDLLAGPKDIIRFLIRKQFPELIDKIVSISPPLCSNKIYIGFSKKVDGYQKRLKAFNEGVALMKKDGSFVALAKKHDITIQEKNKSNK